MKRMENRIIIFIESKSKTEKLDPIEEVFEQK
jgi:hypothetical protein